jgi:hypothetical protein
MTETRHRQFHSAVLDDFIPWLVEAIPTYSGPSAPVQAPEKAFAMVQTMMAMDDEEIIAGRCIADHDRAPWGTLFADLFAPHQGAITRAVLASGSFAEACAGTAALVLPCVPVPPGVLARWAQPFWRWPA